MDPTLEAAIVAVAGTVVVAVTGFWTTRSVTGRTLAEQRDRTLNERFATAADQLGSDKPSAVRLAGVYAMAGLADDWPENRQICVDVLCGYLRLPYEPDPGGNASADRRLDWRASREVRDTVVRVIAAHLQDGAAVSWQRLRFDFTGAVFDGGDFSRAVFVGQVSFAEAVFSGGQVNFTSAKFSGGQVNFFRAGFSGGQVNFFRAGFSGGQVNFFGAGFSGGQVNFNLAEFSGGHVSFATAEFSGGQVSFPSAEFSGGQVSFANAAFSDGHVSFDYARFPGGQVSFDNAVYSGGQVSFTGAKFSGSQVFFNLAEFSGGQVDFSRAASWAHPPEFDWDGAPPPGVKLPKKEDQSQA